MSVYRVLFFFVCVGLVINASQPPHWNATSQSTELVELVIEMGKNIITAIESGQRMKDIDVNIDRLFANDQSVKEMMAMLFVQMANLTSRIDALEH